MDVTFASITFAFLLFLFDIVAIPFRNKILWDNKRFKGIYVMAEIVYYDRIELSKSAIDVTIVNYMMNGKSVDALIQGKQGKEIGEKIKIKTDGEIAFCVQTNWRDIITGSYIIKIIVCLLLGYFFFMHLEEINGYYIIGCIIFDCMLVLTQPSSYRQFIKILKTEAGWHENV